MNINQLIRKNIHKPICINLDPDDVSLAGQREIAEYLFNNDLQCPDYTFDWRIRTSRGTLGKRLSSYNYNEFGRKVEKEDVEEINNIANKHRAYFETFYLKFDNGMFWRLGDFKDGDSCYWQSKSHMRAKLNGSMRVYAVKLYEDMMFDRHFGRALLIMNCPDENSLVCINAYPKGFQVTNIGRLLVKFASMNEVRTMTKYIHLEYRSSWQDYIWINGGNGAIVTPYSENKTIQSSIDLFDYGVYFETCSMCGRKTNRLKSVGNEIGCVCPLCAQKIINCDWCGTTTLRSSTNVIKCHGITKFYCNKCIGLVTTCDYCGYQYILAASGNKPHVTHIHNVPRSRIAYVPIYGFICSVCAGRQIATISAKGSNVGYNYTSLSETGVTDSYYKGRKNAYPLEIKKALATLTKAERIIYDGNRDD